MERPMPAFKLTVQKRLYAGFGVLVAMTAVIAGVGFWVSQNASTQIDNMVKQDVDACITSLNDRGYVNQAKAARQAFMLTENPAEAKRFDEAVLAASQGFGDTAKAQAEQYNLLFHEVVEDINTRGNAIARTGLYGQLDEVVQKIDEAVQIQGLTELVAAMLMARQAETAFLLSNNKQDRQVIQSHIKSFKEQAELYGLPSDFQKDIDKLWQSYIETVDTVAKTNAHLNTAAQQLALIETQIVEGINQEAEAAQASIHTQNDKLATSLSGMQMLLVGVFMAVLLAAIAISWQTARSIVKPVHALVHDIQEVQNNLDLTRPITNNRSDEIGDLARAFGAFLKLMHQSVSSFSEATIELAGATDRIQSASQSVAQGMDDQHRQVHSMSASLDEMSDSINEVAKNAKIAANSAEQSGNAAKEGGTIVGGAIQNMDAIETTVGESSSVVEQLGQRSDQIGEVVQVINDIAEQTNLLALNAAIEAARAGEHGRGFAVVADEVRKLADRTTQATGEISEQIQTIQQETGEAVTRMKRGTDEVANGAQAVQTTGDALAKIRTSTQDVSSMVNSIASASTQQAAASEQVSQSMAEITRVTDEANTQTQEAASTASLISQRVNELQGLVERFKI